MRISDVMTPCPHSIGATTSLEEALRVMAFRGIKHLPVVDEGGDLLGVLGEQEGKLAQFVCHSTSFCPTVAHVCQKDPIVASATDTVSKVVDEMYQSKKDCVLVADESGNFVGIFTTMDACRALNLLLADSERKR